MIINTLNSFVFINIRFIEMLGVMMRISSFFLVSWMGSESPLLLVWAFNTADAVLLSWCSILKKDSAYILLNVFWIVVGIVGMFRASHFSFTDFKSAGLHLLMQTLALFSS
ncbi:MAG: hypothetical protein PHY16_19580 [Methylobacter sp.]|nr:hypothetical protein [Methylobacter sp.]